MPTSSSLRAGASRCTPGRTATVSVAGIEVGYAGELLPAIAEEADLPGRVLVAELDLEVLLRLAGERPVAASLATYPAATQDVSLVVAAEVPAAAVRRRSPRKRARFWRRCVSSTTTAVRGVADGEKVLTFALRFRADDRTLTSAEATEAKLAGVSSARARVGARLRD